ncbi:hypothetical protein [Streptomyces sp. NPDC059639]|uniref:hypothetical protein n=1 Tax=Streptomyces sp. NPDC059639 TaxID=3346891 RepID=UPI0036CF21A4
MPSAADIAAATDLDGLVSRASTLARIGRIRLVSSMLSLPKQHAMPVKSLDCGATSGEDFLNFASHVGSGFLYARFDRLDADAELDAVATGAQSGFAGQDTSRCTALFRRIHENDGRCTEAQLAFTDGMALFTWSGEAAWLTAIADELRNLPAPGEAETGADPAVGEGHDFRATAAHEGRAGVTYSCSPCR